MTNYDPALAQSIARLKEHSPTSISTSSICPFDKDARRFSVHSLGRDIDVTYPDGIVTFAGSTEPLPFDWGLILLNYLSTAKATPLSGQWVTYGALPQGRFFAANIRNSVLQPLAAFYSTCDKSRLRQALKSIAFSELDMQADLAAVGNFAPRVPVAVQFWDGEDDLAPSCQILHDSTVTDQMHIEDIAALCGVVRRRITDAYAGM